MNLIVITGAADGIGAEMARQWAMTGFFESLRMELGPAGISVAIAYPGVVATQIRRRGFNAQGQPAGSSGLDERGAVSVEECARLIIDGAERRKRENVMSVKGKVGRWIKLIAPRLVDRIALHALKQEARPR
jgi:short-subunit dehydrogenase